MSESATLPAMTEEQLKSVRAAVQRAVGKGGVYLIAMVDEADVEVVTNVHRDDLESFLLSLGGQINDHGKLMKMKAAGSA